jgi:hypothetical protein
MESVAIAPTPTGSNSTAQIIVIIVLVVIAIVLFVVFIVFTVQIPIATVTPFADGTRIKIKSLANNRYLKPVVCSQILPPCSDPFYTNFCGGNNGNVAIAAIGTENDIDTIFQLCQNSNIGQAGSIESGLAKYELYLTNTQNTNVLSLNNENFLTIFESDQTCIAEKSTSSGCGNQIGVQNRTLFSFILDEKALNSGTTASGAYKIVDACFPNIFLVCTGQGNSSLNNPGCPPFVYTTSSPGSTGGCTTDLDPRCTLSFLFEIEVLPP